MLVLAIDTATPAVTAGVLRLGPAESPGVGPPELLAERVTEDPRAHTELLTPSVLAVLAEAGAGLTDLAAVVCGAGPGPFTGLRVGLATAAALGDALGLPVHPVCSLDAIAAGAGLDEAAGAGDLLVATDARRREVYWARYAASGRIGDPAVGAPAEVPTDGVTRVAGACAELLRSPDGGRLPVVAPRFPPPLGLVAVAAPALRSGAAPGPLRPRYLRRPDAVVPGERKRVWP